MEQIANIGAAMVPQLTLITKRDIPALMSKRISLTNDGNLRSEASDCRMIVGMATRVFAVV